MTRSADQLQSRITSIIQDIRIWVDGDGANPAIDLRKIMEEYGAKGKHVGIEYGLQEEKRRKWPHSWGPVNKALATGRTL